MRFPISIPVRHSQEGAIEGFGHPKTLQGSSNIEDFPQISVESYHKGNLTGVE